MAIEDVTPPPPFFIAFHPIFPQVEWLDRFGDQSYKLRSKWAILFILASLSFSLAIVYPRFELVFLRSYELFVHRNNVAGLLAHSSNCQATPSSLTLCPRQSPPSTCCLRCQCKPSLAFRVFFQTNSLFDSDVVSWPCHRTALPHGTCLDASVLLMVCFQTTPRLSQPQIPSKHIQNLFNPHAPTDSSLCLMSRLLHNVRRPTR
jgi:hypothetical protein